MAAEEDGVFAGCRRGNAGDRKPRQRERLKAVMDFIQTHMATIPSRISFGSRGGELVTDTKCDA